MVDIRDNHTANSEKDEKMLNWTINEIRKTCGNLPSEKLKKLVDSIKIVIKQRDVYLSKIEQELKTKREQLRKELDHENIDVKTASAGDIFIQKIKEYPDMLKIPMDQYAKINEMKQNDRESFIKKL